MAEINVNETKHTGIITQKDIEKAKFTYECEKYEEDVWEVAYDDAKNCVVEVDTRITGLENIISGLEVKEEAFSNNLETIKTNQVSLQKQYDEIKLLPKDQLSDEQREFLQKYDDRMKQLHQEENKLNFSLEEMNNIIKNKEKEISVNERQKKMIETHIEDAVKPKLEKETEEANIAYDNWQELVKEKQEQDKIFRDLL